MENGSFEMNVDASIVVAGNFLVSAFEAKSPSTPVNRELKDATYTKMAFWGNQNDFPQLIMEELKKNSDLGSYLEVKANILFGEGVGYKIVNTTTGEDEEIQFDLEIENFLRRNWQFPIAAGANYFKFLNVFPQLTVNTAKTKIHWLVNRPAPWCRYSLQDETGRVARCYINANWPNAKLEDKETQNIPVLDPILYDAARLKAHNDGPHFLYPLSYPTDETYYQIANWNALRNSKWLELANQIPKFKQALMKNQLTIKYHIQFPDYHWKWKFPNWDSLKAEEKVAKKQAEITQITTFLQGEENAGKAIVTGYKFDEVTKKEYPGIKIEAIDDKIKDGIYLEDSVEATIKILSAIGLDPSLVGVIPGKGGSNRSGSDKREALNIAMSLMTAHAKILLQPYEFISDYNGWNTPQRLIKWRFKSPLLQTLDDVTPSKRETVPTDAEQPED